MKNTLIIVIFLLSILSINAQTEYTSKSGKIYKIGDTIHLGKPINISSGPLIATNGHWSSIKTEKHKALRNMNFVNKKVIVTRIEQTEKAKLFFKLYGKKLYVLIDDALLNGEVLSSYTVVSEEIDKYDKLKKLKELLDMEAITTEEFNSEKKKLLNKN